MTMQHAVAESEHSEALTLDALAVRSYAALEELYRAAARPRSMRAVDGAPKGRMLAVRHLEGPPVGALLRNFAASSAFVWDGKTFTARSDERGVGINRIRLPGVLGRQDLFPFETSFGPSALDGGPTLILDYDLARNPGWIRKVHDEIREVAPGLFLGPAMWKAAAGPTTLLWFALDTRVPGDA
jgi:hypothetical protein